MTKKKANPSKLARSLALQGDIDGALPLLQECASAGDDSASASLAEMLAFLGRWEDCIPRAARLLANPYAVRASNVFDDMVRLLGRAGRETGAWSLVASTARDASRQVEERLQRNEPGFPEEKLRAERTRLTTILQQLAEYADRKGLPPHELVQFVASTSSPPSEEAYQAAVARNKGKSPQHLLGLAIAFAQDADAIRLFGTSDKTTFEDAVHVAQALIRQGKPEEAWNALASRLADWSPVDVAQVAPVILLTDPHFQQIVTPERAQFVIRSPRAGGG